MINAIDVPIFKIKEIALQTNIQHVCLQHVAKTNLAMAETRRNISFCKPFRHHL